MFVRPALCALAAALLPGAAALHAAEPPAVRVTFSVSVPVDSPAGGAVYIVGDFQGWNPGDPACRLAMENDGRWRTTLAFAPGERLLFKLTRGSWETVEKGPGGEEIANRELVAPDSAGAAVTVELAVAKWRDQTPEPGRPHTATGDLTVITVSGYLDGRPVWVWLPHGYADARTRRYPVLYMWDGQNVFDDATSFAGEWGVDESCARLIAAGQMAPVIVVAVENGGGARVAEYTPWKDAQHGGGGGDAHLDALVKVLKPAIDFRYRTLPDAAHTAIAGSSLGGLMALYAGYVRPDVFGLVAAVSPSLWWDGGRVLGWARGRAKPPLRLYADMGTAEESPRLGRKGGDADTGGLRDLEGLCLAQGFTPGDDLLIVVDEGGRHNEASWRARFPRALQFLFPTSPTRVGGAGDAPR